jgi:hypothetical protein
MNIEVKEVKTKSMNSSPVRLSSTHARPKSATSYQQILACSADPNKPKKQRYQSARGLKTDNLPSKTQIINSNEDYNDDDNRLINIDINNTDSRKLNIIKKNKDSVFLNKNRPHSS